jgi:hypothetical protein
MNLPAAAVLHQVATHRLWLSAHIAAAAAARAAHAKHDDAVVVVLLLLAKVLLHQ